MKTLRNIILTAVLLTTALAAKAEWVSGHFRSNGTYVAPYYRSDYGSLGGGSRSLSGDSGYVYRNPYAANPSVHVDGYYRSSGTYVLPYRRTAPNDTLTDNLNYRGYGTIRVPRDSYEW